MKVVGRTVRLFLVDGTPTGTITAEIMNWTGHVLIAPRSNLPSVLKRGEACRTGVYLLLGDMTADRKVYIGESDDVGRRVAEHAKNDKKDFFERFILITSKDQNLTKAHARYLESRLTELARVAGRSKLENSTSPVGGILPESDLADMEFFVEQIQIVLPVFGVDSLRPPLQDAAAQEASPASKSPIEAMTSNTIELEYPKTKHGYQAKGFMKDGVVVVRRGSTALKNPNFSESSMDNYRLLREKLIDESVLVDSENPKLLVFSRDYEFASPSAAACVIHGGSRNGRYEWREVKSGQRLKDYEASLTDQNA